MENQSIWVSSNDSGVIKKEGLIFKSYNSFNSPLPDNFVHTLITDGGIVWIGTSQGGLVRFDESLFLSVVENMDHKVQLYPVPANDHLNIASASHNWERLEICDYTGRVVAFADPVQTASVRINTSDFSPGFYYARIISNSNKAITKLFTVVH